MREVADLLGRPFRQIPVPVSVPALEGAIAAVVADEDRPLITALLEGLDDDLLVERNAAEAVFGVRPMGFREAARRALPGIVDARSTVDGG